MRREDPLDPTKSVGERLAEGLRIMSIDRSGLPYLMEDTDSWIQATAEQRERRSWNHQDLRSI